MKITKNFSLSEFTKSNTAIANGVSNYPTAEHISNISLLCENVLQPLRDYLGASIRITSGYRSEALNSILRGASKTSQHCYGMASDIEFWVDGQEKNSVLFHAIKSLDLPFDQLIWEFGDDEEPNWIHVSHNKDGNRKQILKAVKIDSKTQYILL